MTDIPTLAQIFAGIIADLQSQFNIVIPLFGKSFLRGLASEWSAKLWTLYLLVGKVQKNVFPDLAESELIGGTLERFGRVKLGRGPFPATQGQYTATVTGTVGSIIPAGRTFVSNDDSTSPGKLFIIDTQYVLDGVTPITIRALESGTGSLLNVSDQLTVTAPIALVNSVITIDGQVVEPLDAEDLEDYRQKILDSFRLEVQGGSGSDYRIWASEVQGVAQSYPYAASGETSEVNLYIEASDSDSIPSPTLLQAVQDNIELPTADRPARKPLTAIVNYLPVTPRLIDIEINDFQDLTFNIQTLIEAAMEERLSAIRPFVDSIDIVANRNDYFDTNIIVSVVLAANPGSVFGAVTMTIDGVPDPAITFSNGDIPKLNSINYV